MKNVSTQFGSSKNVIILKNLRVDRDGASRHKRRCHSLNNHPVKEAIDDDLVKEKLSSLTMHFLTIYLNK